MGLELSGAQGKGGGDAKVQIWKVWGVLLAWKGAAQGAGRTDAEVTAGM